MGGESERTVRNKGDSEVAECSSVRKQHGMGKHMHGKARTALSPGAPAPRNRLTLLPARIRVNVDFFEFDTIFSARHCDLGIQGVWFDVCVFEKVGGVG